MTVRENLELGAYLRRDTNVTEDLDRVFSLFPRLHEREKQKAGTMSGGEQQMLAMGRALMANPTLLMLDEPSMGLAPILVDRIYETVAEINRQGTTILLVEQNANYALDVSARGYVLETGHGRAHQRLRGAAGRSRSAEGVPGHMIVFGLLGATALYLTFAWLLSAIVASYLSDRKGYGEQARPRVRAAAQRDRRDHLAGVAGASRLAVEEDRAVRPRQVDRTPTRLGRAARRVPARDRDRHRRERAPSLAGAGRDLAPDDAPRARSR